MSLVDGKILAGQVCPYRNQCPSAREGTCHHKGEQHNVPYSCGTARMFKIFGRPTDIEAKVVV
jgi:hypothetical protein